MILFPQIIDEDIAEDDSVCFLDSLVDNFMLYNVYKLYKPVVASTVSSIMKHVVVSD